MWDYVLAYLPVKHDIVITKFHFINFLKFALHNFKFFTIQDEGRNILTQLISLINNRPNNIFTSNTNRFLQAIAILLEVLNTELSSKELDENILRCIHMLRTVQNANSDSMFQSFSETILEVKYDSSKFAIV